MLNYFRILVYCLIFHKSDHRNERYVETATLEEAHFIVSIRYNEKWDEFGRNHYCSGALITYTAVVTGGRCLKAGSRPNDYLFVMGSLNLTERIVTTLVYRARKYIRHKKFNPENYAHDIMIFFLNGRVSKNQKVHPISLFDRVEPVNPSCFLLGWRRLQPSQESDILLKADIYFLQECSNRYPDLLFDQVGYVCGTSTQDSCVGDYGGPLLCDGKLTGLLSWTKGTCADAKYPTIYANIYFYRKWIQNTLKNSSHSRFITIECVFLYLFYFVIVIIFIL